MLVDQQLIRLRIRIEITGWMRRADVRISVPDIPIGADRIGFGEVTWTLVDQNRLTGMFRVDLAEFTGNSEAPRIM